MRAFTGLDWAVIIGYLALTVTVGIAVTRKAGTSLESYFVAGRSLPWWWLGTSMAATTFAADTPLVVSGIVAQYGVAGNWFWWSWGISHVSLAVVFASLWRRSGVLTDAELVELRYGGRPAALLRGFKAVFFAILVNGIVLGWVIRAMTKIATPFVPWDPWITVIVLFGFVTFYSTLGGIRGVVLTDLIQFVIALVTSVLFAAIAVEHVGGLAGLREGLAATIPNADELLAFLPRPGSAWLPLQVFVLYFAVQWWAQYFADGTGYLAQRVNTAKDDAHAEAGSLWFCVANYGLRTWPWILIGLVALVMFPPGAEPVSEAARMVAGDREMAYPILMAELLPAGLLGLLFVGLLAAFMSTVDTHINWGSSYLVNDIYLRFLRPRAGTREQVLVSRVTVVGIALFAVAIASVISSVEQAWKFFIALGAGLGLPSMLRWIWWRVNAWTEIVGMVSATVAALALYALFPTVRDEYLIAVIAGISTVAALAATLLTPPEREERLAAFAAKVGPPGFWKGFAGAASRTRMRWLAFGWCAGNAGVFGLTFGIGHAVLGSPLRGAALIVLAAAALRLTLMATTRARAVLEPGSRPVPSAARDPGR